MKVVVLYVWWVPIRGQIAKTCPFSSILWTCLANVSAAWTRFSDVSTNGRFVDIFIRVQFNMHNRIQAEIGGTP